MQVIRIPITNCRTCDFCQLNIPNSTWTGPRPALGYFFCRASGVILCMNDEAGDCILTWENGKPACCPAVEEAEYLVCSKCGSKKANVVKLGHNTCFCGGCIEKGGYPLLKDILIDSVLVPD
jgi:hypothetical protein